MLELLRFGAIFYSVVPPPISEQVQLSLSPGVAQAAAQARVTAEEALNEVRPAPSRAINAAYLCPLPLQLAPVSLLFQHHAVSCISQPNSPPPVPTKRTNALVMQHSAQLGCSTRGDPPLFAFVAAVFFCPLLLTRARRRPTEKAPSELWSNNSQQQHAQ